MLDTKQSPETRDAEDGRVWRNRYWYPVSTPVVNGPMRQGFKFGKGSFPTRDAAEKRAAEYLSKYAVWAERYAVTYLGAELVNE